MVHLIRCLAAAVPHAVADVAQSQTSCVISMCVRGLTLDQVALSTGYQIILAVELPVYAQRIAHPAGCFGTRLAGSRLAGRLLSETEPVLQFTVIDLAFEFGRAVFRLCQPSQGIPLDAGKTGITPRNLGLQPGPGSDLPHGVETEAVPLPTS